MRNHRLLYAYSRIIDIINTSAGREEEDGAPIKSDYIAALMSVPRRYIERPLQDIANAGFSASERGALGGYRSTEKGRSASMYDVLDMLIPAAERHFLDLYIHWRQFPVTHIVAMHGFTVERQETSAA